MPRTFKLSAQDAFGNLIVGAFFEFTTPASGATAADSNGDRVIDVITDITGTNATYPVANHSPGSCQVVASRASTATLRFSLDNLPITPVARTSSFTIAATSSVTEPNSDGMAPSLLAIVPTNAFEGVIALDCAAPTEATFTLSQDTVKIPATQSNTSTPGSYAVKVTIQSPAIPVAQSLAIDGHSRPIAALALLFGIYLLPHMKHIDQRPG